MGFFNMTTKRPKSLSPGDGGTKREDLTFSRSAAVMAMYFSGLMTTLFFGNKSKIDVFMASHGLCLGSGGKYPSFAGDISHFYQNIFPGKEKSVKAVTTVLANEH